MVSFWELGKRKPPEPGAAGVQECGPDRSGRWELP